MGGHEEEHCSTRGSVSKLSIGKSRTPKAWKLHATYRTSKFEMGHDQHGF